MGFRQIIGYAWHLLRSMAANVWEYWRVLRDFKFAYVFSLLCVNVILQSVGNMAR